MSDPGVAFDRTRAVLLHRALCAGFVIVAALFGYLLHWGPGALLPDAGGPFIPVVIALAGLPPALLGLLWARPRVPIRPPSLGVEDYWRSGDAGARALLTWTLWEGSGMIGAVGTLLTGSLAPASLAALGLALLLVHGPGYYESRGS